ncbi:MAG: hypothetical protein O7G85_08535 [Planctomycetota bacterium]|nr:hypothetical protein [Planctomycetota bacterium]
MPQPRRDFEDLWDYDHPEETKAKFHNYISLHEGTMSEDERLELLTQLARCESLQGHFDVAHQLLDELEPMLSEATPTARIRSQLERGRTYNAADQSHDAERLFLKAWEEAGNHGFDGYAVDAAHMLGIVHLAKPDVALTWNEKALGLADSSADPAAQKWRGSLHNNMGWTQFAAERFETALEHFEKALDCRKTEGKTDDIREARWCVGRCLRSLGRTEEALAIQQALLKQIENMPEPDGFVYEELAECLNHLSRKKEATPYFRMAHEILSKDAWVVKHEPTRLRRLSTLGLDESS